MAAVVTFSELGRLYVSGLACTVFPRASFSKRFPHLCNDLDPEQAILINSLNVFHFLGCASLKFHVLLLTIEAKCSKKVH